METKYIVENLQSFYDPISLPGGYEFDHAKTLKRASLYYNGKFESGEYDSQGNRKIFFNITKKTCDNATKYVDFDTREFVFTSELPDQEEKNWVLSHDFKQWMKEKGFAKLLNDIAQEYPKGSVVIKKVKDKFEMVNLHNLFMDTSAKSLEDAVFVYESAIMTRYEMRKMKWSGVTDFLKEYEDKTFQVFSCYDLNDEGKKWSRTILARCVPDSWEASGITEKDFDGAETIHNDELEKLPYRELHWEKIEGRWLGFGFPEYLFDAQYAENHRENKERRSMDFSSLRIWKTQDETIGNNMLTDVQNGDIIKTKADIVQVDMAEKNVAQFQTAYQRMQDFVNSITFLFDVNSNSVNTKMPAAMMSMSLQLQSSYFKIKKQNFGIFIKDLIFNDIMPMFDKEKKSEHSVAVMATDYGVEHFVKAIAQHMLDEQARKFAEGRGNGFFPDREELESEKQRIIDSLRKSKNLMIKIPEDYYSDAKYKLDINVMSESQDSAAVQQGLQFAMQLLSTNPAVVQNPMTRTMFFKLLEQSGISPIDLKLFDEASKETPQMMMPMERGGSISVAQPAQLGSSSQQL